VYASSPVRPPAADHDAAEGRIALRGRRETHSRSAQLAHEARGRGDEQVVRALQGCGIHGGHDRGEKIFRQPLLQRARHPGFVERARRFTKHPPRLLEIFQVIPKYSVESPGRR
jgi:hypothetical protein